MLDPQHWRPSGENSSVHPYVFRPQAEFIGSCGLKLPSLIRFGSLSSLRLGSELDAQGTLPSKLARLERLLSVMDSGGTGGEHRQWSVPEPRSGGPKDAQVRDAHYSYAVSEGLAASGFMTSMALPELPKPRQSVREFWWLWTQRCRPWDP